MTLLEDDTRHRVGTTRSPNSRPFRSAASIGGVRARGDAAWIVLVDRREMETEDVARLLATNAVSSTEAISGAARTGDGDESSSSASSGKRGAIESELGGCLRFCLSGLRCSSCVRGVERGVSALAGVRWTAASLDGAARVAFEPGVNPEALARAIEEEVQGRGFECRLVSVEKDGVKEEESTRKTVKISVDGMRCGGCVSGLERALGSTKGIYSASVSLIPRGLGVVEYESTLTGVRDIIDVVTGLGYTASVCRETESDSHACLTEESKYREDLETSAKFTLPVLLINLIMVRIWNPSLFRGISLWILVKWALASKVHFGVGMRFHDGALKSVRRGTSNMDVLISLGTNVAYGVSVLSILYSLLFGSMFARDYFDTSTLLTTFILIGKYLETSARGKTSESIKKLLELTPRKAILMTPIPTAVDVDYTEREIETELIHVGDALKVLPGARVPADGTVIRGEAYVDESMVTGETMPVSRSLGQNVVGGTINEGNSFVMRAEKLGADSALHRIVQLVEDAQLSKAPIQAFADRVSNVFVPFVVAVAGLTFFAWLIAGWAGSIPSQWIPEGENKALFAMMFGIAVLVTACPCALGLATPTAIMVGTSVAAKNGILIKGADALERAGNIDVVVFDKTGTLTTGMPTVMAFVSREQASFERLISLVVRVEKESEHPIAKAVRDYARRKSPAEMPSDAVSEVTVLAGQGVECIYEGTPVVLGNQSLMESNGLRNAHESIKKFADDHSNQGHTVVYVGIGASIEGAFAVSDELKSDAREAISELKARGIESVMITGDNWKTARAIANTCGIETVYAEASPQEKADRVKEIQARCSPRSKNTFIPMVVAMVGDGINDAPSLASSDVAMAIGAGTDIAIEAADFVLMHANLHAVVNAIDISRKTFRQIRHNYVWALGYNVIALPLAAGVFYPHIRVPPWLASMLMAFSSISVVLASLSLKKTCAVQHQRLHAIKIVTHHAYTSSA